MNSLNPSKPIVGVGAIVIRHGKILLEKRSNDPGKGKWSVPGGKVEIGETLEQTVIREVKEETGLTVRAPVIIDAVSQISLDKKGEVKYHFVIIDYLVSYERGEAQAASDAAALEWVPLDGVEEKDLTKSFREFFVKNRERLERHNSAT
jgi:8-oxo-dGTP diphosphatase